MTLIYVPKRELWKPDPIEVPYRVRGLFRMQVLGPDRKLRKDTGWFPNIVTNQGLDYLGSRGDWLTNCAVGTGNSTPAATDTVLNSQVAYINNNNGQSPNNGGNSSSAPYYGYLNVSYSFGQGAAAGNLQEIGVGIDATTHLFSRALILNNVGVPTTLTVLANEYLNVSYQVQIYNPTVDTTGTVVVAGTTCNYTMRAAYAGDPGYWGFGGFNSYPKPFGLAGCNVFNDVALQPILSGPIGTSQGTQDSVAVAGYTAGTYYVDGTATFGFGKCNGGANNSALCTFGNAYGGMGAAQIIFGTTIPKTGTQVMTLTFRQTWARYP